MSLDNRINRLEQQLNPDGSQVSADSLHAALNAMPAADRAALEAIAKEELEQWANEHQIPLKTSDLSLQRYGDSRVKVRWI